MEPTSESRLDAILAPDQVVSVTAALERAREAGHEVEVGQPSGDLRWTLEAPEWRAGLGPAPRKALAFHCKVTQSNVRSPGTSLLVCQRSGPQPCTALLRGSRGGSSGERTSADPASERLLGGLTLSKAEQKQQ